MPEAGIVAIIRKGKASDKAFFANEYTTGPWGDTKSALPSVGSTTQRKLLKETTFVTGGKKTCGKILRNPGPQLYLKSRIQNVRE